MARLSALPLPIAIVDIINLATYGICDTIALMLTKKGTEIHGGRTRNGYILLSGLQDGPNTILVATGLHELEATPKPG